MARSTKTGERGFTLIELLVVLTMIVVLASMGLAQYRTSVIHSREAVLHEDLFRMREAIDQYYADKAQWPSTLDALVSDGYLRKLPEDPFTKSTSTWQAIPAEPDPNNPTAEPGVYDVKRFGRHRARRHQVRRVVRFTAEDAATGGSRIAKRRRIMPS